MAGPTISCGAITRPSTCRSPTFRGNGCAGRRPASNESYVDLEAGAWTHVKIEVSGVRARLFVNGATQPVLIVNDLKRGVTSGAIGLWVGPGTEAYFRNLFVTTN
ncbi:MAG TPA: family 16 glycoside hydrolase [Vicinamibacterales bacterium]|nr:family 16 glycoside hydrolase [Vicinamibacterales bacterium]